MALPTQLLPIKFGKGRSDKHAVFAEDPGSIDTLENMTFTKAGDLRKRDGYTDLGTSRIIDNVQFPYKPFNATDYRNIATLNGELVRFARNYSETYFQEDDKWSYRGPLESAKATEGRIQGNNQARDVKDPQTITHGGFRVVAWDEDSSASLTWSIYDEETGASLVQQYAPGVGSQPKLAKCGTHIIIFFVLESAGADALQMASFDTAAFVTTSTGGFNTSVAVTTDLDDTLSYYDISESSTADNSLGEDVVFVASNRHSALGMEVKRVSITAGAPVVDAAVAIAEDCDDGITVLYHASADEVYVAYGRGATGTTRHLSLAYNGFSIASGPANLNAADTVRNIDAVEVPDASGNPQTMVIYEPDLTAAADLDRNVTGVFVRADTLAVGSQVISPIEGLNMAGGGVLIGDNVYFMVSRAGTTYKMYIAVAVPADAANTDTGIDATPVSTFFQFQGGNTRSRSNVSRAVLDPNSDVDVRWAGAVTTLVQSAQATPDGNVVAEKQGGGLMQLTFDSAQETHNTAKLGRSLYMTGGVTNTYSGNTWSPTGFLYGPEAADILVAESTQAAPPALTTLKTYTYQVFYEWVDQSGQVHRSPASAPFQHTLTGTNNKITLTIRNYRIGLFADLQQRGTVAVYRSQADGSLLTRTQHITGNDPRIGTAGPTRTFTDVKTDADIASNPVSPVTGGVISADTPPASTCIVQHRNRLFVGGCPRGNEVYYSKKHREGLPAEFSALFKIEAGTATEPITALASLDDKLIIFKKRKIYVSFGDGPNDLGQGQGFSQPRPIETDTGCDNIRSVVNIPQGVLFHSERGIYLLDRSLQVSFVGHPVEDESGTILSSALDNKAQQVRWHLDTGKALVYDYFFQQWSIFLGQNVCGGAVVYNDVIHRIFSTGRVYYDTPGVFSDNGTVIQTKVVTSWIQLAQNSGIQRIKRAYLLGEYLEDAELQISVGFDFESTYSDFYWGSTDLSTATSETHVLAGVHLPRQKCTSVRFSIEDFGGPDGGVSQGFSFNGLTLEAGVKKGVWKIPAGDRK